MSGTAPYEPIEAVRALAVKLTKTVDLARALTQSGRAVDLSGLEGEVGLLCAKSLDLPPEEGRSVRAHLIALANAIEALSCALVTHRASSD